MVLLVESEICTSCSNTKPLGHQSAWREVDLFKAGHEEDMKGTVSNPSQSLPLSFKVQRPSMGEKGAQRDSLYHPEVCCLSSSPKGTSQCLWLSFSCYQSQEGLLVSIKDVGGRRDKDEGGEIRMREGR